MEENITTTEAVEVVPSAAVSEETIPQKKQRKPINQQKLMDNIWGWVFCIPLIVGTVWFVYIAFVLALMLSFTDFSMSKGLWDVIGNYASEVDKFASSVDHAGHGGAFFWYAQAFTKTIDGSLTNLNEMGAYLLNTVVYLIGIPIGMVLSMFFAVCMSRDIKGGNLFRVIYYLPCVASTVAIVYTFKIMFDSTGVINQLLGLAGDEAGQGAFIWMATTGNAALTWGTMTGSNSTSAFMIDPYWCQGLFTKLVIIIMAVWKGLGGTIILYAAGLAGVNAATKEAAQIDGANGWQIFWKVTMPDLYPVIFYNIVTAVIGGMQIYMEPVLLVGEDYMTSGYVSLIWNYGINGNGNAMAARPSQGAALGMLLAILIFVITMFQFWLDSRNKD